MNVRDGLPDFFGPTALPAQGKKPMKKTKPPVKPKGKKAPPQPKAQWQNIADQMTGKC